MTALRRLLEDIHFVGAMLDAKQFCQYAECDLRTVSGTGYCGPHLSEMRRVSRCIESRCIECGNPSADWLCSRCYAFNKL